MSSARSRRATGVFDMNSPDVHRIFLKRAGGAAYPNRVDVAIFRARKRRQPPRP